MQIRISSRTDGILSIELPYIEDIEDDHRIISEFLSGITIRVSGDYPLGEALAEEMRDYFEGKCLRFHPYALIRENATPFEKKALGGLGHIPFGRTVSYSELARIIGCPRGARAVGQALKKNPWPILLPCHRVIGARGELTGFSSGKGWKKALLGIEKHLGGVQG